MKTIPLKRTIHTDIKRPLYGILKAAFGNDQADSLLPVLQHLQCNRDQMVTTLYSSQSSPSLELHLRHLAAWLRDLLCLAPALALAKWAETIVCSAPAGAVPVLPVVPGVPLEFQWFAAFQPKRPPICLASPLFELVSVIFNVGAVYSCCGFASGRDSSENVRLAVKYFQKAAGCFCLLHFILTPTEALVSNSDGEVSPPKSSRSTISGTAGKESPENCTDEIPDYEYLLDGTSFQEICPELSPDGLRGLSLLLSAQAQACAYEKGVRDKLNRSLLSKLASQAAQYFEQARHHFQQIGQHLPETLIPWIHTQELSFRCAARYQRGFEELTEAESKSEGFGIVVARFRSAMEALREAECLASSCHIEADLETLKSTVQTQLVRVERDNNTVYMEAIPSAASLEPISALDAVRVPHFKLLGDFVDSLEEGLPQAPPPKDSNPLASFSHAELESVFEDLLPLHLVEWKDNFRTNVERVANDVLVEATSVRQRLRDLMETEQLGLIGTAMLLVPSDSSVANALLGIEAFLASLLADEKPPAAAPGISQQLQCDKRSRSDAGPSNVSPSQRRLPLHIRNKVERLEASGLVTEAEHHLVLLQKHADWCQVSLHIIEESLLAEAAYDCQQRNRLGKSWDRKPSELLNLDYFQTLTRYQSKLRASQEVNKSLRAGYDLMQGHVHQSTLLPYSVGEIEAAICADSIASQSLPDGEGVTGLLHQVLAMTDKLGTLAERSKVTAARISVERELLELRVPTELRQLALQALRDSRATNRISNLDSGAAERIAAPPALCERTAAGLRELATSHITALQSLVQEAQEAIRSCDQQRRLCDSFWRKHRGEVYTSLPAFSRVADFDNAVTNALNLHHNIQDGKTFFNGFRDRIRALANEVDSWILARKLEADGLVPPGLREATSEPPGPRELPPSSGALSALSSDSSINIDSTVLAAQSTPAPNLAGQPPPAQSPQTHPYLPTLVDGGPGVVAWRAPFPTLRPRALPPPVASYSQSACCPPPECSYARRLQVADALPFYQPSPLAFVPQQPAQQYHTAVTGYHPGVPAPRAPPHPRGFQANCRARPSINDHSSTPFQPRSMLLPPPRGVDPMRCSYPCFPGGRSYSEAAILGGPTRVKPLQQQVIVPVQPAAAAGSEPTRPTIAPTTLEGTRRQSRHWSLHDLLSSRKP